MKRKAKKSKRAKSQYRALDPKLNRINLRDVVDYDYIDQLSPKDKAYLDKFTNEYYTADMRPTKNYKSEINKSKKSKQKIYRNNNARNQDITSYLGNYGAMDSYEDLTDDDLVAKNPESALIEIIDLKKKR